MHLRPFALSFISLVASLAACTTTGTGTRDDAASTLPDDVMLADASAAVPDASVPVQLEAGPQTPPTTGHDAMEAWLASGAYRAWHCQPAAHPARDPSPHGMNRICSNDVLSATTGDAPYPVGSAGVKELVSSTGEVTGYSVYLKAGDGTTGASWYWYERIGTRQVADGMGSSGAPRIICVSCHAGADREFVYTPVP